MSIRLSSIRLLVGMVLAAACVLLAGCVPSLSADPSRGEVEMNEIERAVSAAVPGSRADAGVHLSGLARQLEVTMYSTTPPSTDQLRYVLAAIASRVPSDVSAVVFRASDEEYNLLDLSAQFADLGVPSSALDDGGSGFTSFNIDWFRSAFGDQ